MIRQYSEYTDKVIVMISNPSTKSARSTKINTIISTNDVIRIFNIYNNSYGLKNVEFIESSHPSPIRAAYDYAELELKDVNVIFGASTKDEDFNRWRTVTTYMSKHNPSITVIDPKKSSVKPLFNNDNSISASDWRNQIDNIDIYKNFVPGKVVNTRGVIKNIFNILNGK